MRNRAGNIYSKNAMANVPTANIRRSKFKKQWERKMTFNVGDIVPLAVDEVLPGDTHELSSAEVIRTSTMIKPIMDNMALDIFAFFVPNRLLWHHWKELHGENRTDKWTQKITYKVPQIEAPNGGWQAGTLADHLGIPTKVSGFKVRALEARAYALIFNEWFRDQNNQDPTLFTDDDLDTVGTNGTNQQLDPIKLGALLKANKYPDYFTKALPQTQKGNSVQLPLGLTAIVTAPNGGNISSITTPISFEKSNPLTQLSGQASFTAGEHLTAQNNNSVDKISFEHITGLKADLSTATAATINQLRVAVATQELLERDARGGTRYVEIIESHYGVTSPDARQQRPEFLGAKEIPLATQQIPQTSPTNQNSTPQGNLAAISVTNNHGHIFKQSFTEHGIIMVLGVVRTNHTYQQGLNRNFSKINRFDYAYPELANLSEQAILNKEIYLQGTAQDEEAFGYQERYAEYKYKPSEITGDFRSNSNRTLDVWHLADKYANLPVLSQEWINETKTNLDRTLAVTSTTADQILLDIAFTNYNTRPLPVHSIPKLGTHI